MKASSTHVWPGACGAAARAVRSERGTGACGRGSSRGSGLVMEGVYEDKQPQERSGSSRKGGSLSMLPTFRPLGAAFREATMADLPTRLQARVPGSLEAMLPQVELRVCGRFDGATHELHVAMPPVALCCLAGTGNHRPAPSCPACGKPSLSESLPVLVP